MSGPLRHLGLGLRLAAAHLLRRRIPSFVQLAPTSRCNLTCRYCFAQFSKRERDCFPLPELLKVVDGLAALGSGFIMITGGEPMMYPWIAELVERISYHRIECLLNTNGTRVAERMDELAGVDVFSVSLDGPKTIHNYYRGSGTYEVAIDTVKAARSRGKRVQLQYTMTRDLQTAFGHVNEVAEEFGCFIGINFLRPQLRADGEVVGPAEASQEETEKFLDRLIEERPRTLPYPRRLLEYVRRWPYEFSRHIIARENDLRGLKPIPCLAGRCLIAIDSKGDIYPCTKWFYTRPVGNCADGDIKRAWHDLKEVECLACLDLGCNLLNNTLGLNPSALAGLLSAF